MIYFDKQNHDYSFHVADYLVKTPVILEFNTKINLRN